MNAACERFLRDLSAELGDLDARADILAEYESHLYELEAAGLLDDDLAYEVIVRELGSPRRIAELWRQEAGVTPRRLQRLFIVLNGLIFVGGGLLTFSYHRFGWGWLDRLWQLVTSVPFLLIFAYCLFWGLVGYEIGREFGHRGKVILQRTYLIAIIPNLLLMYLVVFRIFPHGWFGDLLSESFIIICIVVTGLLYPVAYVGYRWGKRVSV